MRTKPFCDLCLTAWYPIGHSGAPRQPKKYHDGPSVGAQIQQGLTSLLKTMMDYLFVDPRVQDGRKFVACGVSIAIVDRVSRWVFGPSCCFDWGLSWLKMPLEVDLMF